MNPNISSGSVEGTGALITVNCGFVPASIRVVNVDSANHEQLEFVRGMTDGHAIKTTNAARSAITANGISLVGDAAGDEVEQGFTIGTDADVNANGETIYYEAVRGGAGAQY